MSRARTLLALLAIPAFLAAAAIPAVAKKAHKSSAPVIKSISPMRIQIGHTLTIRGKGFIKGKHKNTVVFMGAGKRVVWVRADRSSTRTIKVKLPSKLVALLDTKAGTQQPTRLLVRVIARKSGRAFTKRGKSPIVSPSTASTRSGSEACPGVSNPLGDSDGDGLSNGLETSLPFPLNPCNADTDGDGVPDGYEYQSALDLNRNAGTSATPWPFPGKRPYPNPLDAGDAGTDYDGDGLVMAQEYAGSKYLGGGIAYSDGDQTTGPRITCGVDVSASYCVYADTNGDGQLQDDEKDADADGLPNWDESQGRETQAWWTGRYKGERPYPISYPNLNWLDPDTDGDGVNDAADDTDHDGYTNLQEIDRDYATSIFQTLGAYDPASGLNSGITLASTPGHPASVNPDNPCLPDWMSGACMKHPPFENPPAPFDGSVDVTWPSGTP